MTAGSMGHSREPEPEPSASLLCKSYTGCYLVFTFLHSARTSACVFTCTESWLHNYIPLCTCTGQVGSCPQMALDTPEL